MSAFFFALLVFFAYGCEKDCPEPIQVLNSCFIDPQGWHSPSLTKEELKALDLKLRQEAITFREGERVVYLPTTQTAIILDFATQLRGRGYQTALIQFEKSIETKTVSAFDLVKKGRGCNGISLKLTKDEVSKISKMREEGTYIKDIAKKFDVDRSTIRRTLKNN